MMKWFPVAFMSGLALVAFSSCGAEEAGAQSTDKTAAADEEEGCLGDCEGDKDVPAAMTAQVTKDDPSGVYGAGITLEEFTQISAIVAAPEDFEGQRVLVKGDALGVCEKRGCWVELKGDKDFEKIRVKVEDGVIVFPATCLGNEVVVEGVVEKLVIPEERHREIIKGRVEKKGEVFDPASVTGPMIVWQIKGLGAQIATG